MRFVGYDVSSTFFHTTLTLLHANTKTLLTSRPCSSGFVSFPSLFHDFGLTRAVTAVTGPRLCPAYRVHLRPGRAFSKFSSGNVWKHLPCQFRCVIFDLLCRLRISYSRLRSKLRELLFRPRSASYGRSRPPASPDPDRPGSHLVDARVFEENRSWGCQQQ